METKTVVGEGRQTKKQSSRKINSCFKLCEGMSRSEFEKQWLLLPEGIRKKLTAKEISFLIMRHAVAQVVIEKAVAQNVVSIQKKQSAGSMSHIVDLVAKAKDRTRVAVSMVGGIKKWITL